MNQGQLTRMIAKRFFLTQVESGEIIAFTLDKMTERLRRGERIYLRGFGSLRRERRAAKRLRHPKTGRLMTLPARVTVDFQPSERLLKAVRSSLS